MHHSRSKNRSEKRIVADSIQNLTNGNILFCLIQTRNSFDRRHLHEEAKQKGFDHTTFIHCTQTRRTLTTAARDMISEYERLRDLSPDYYGRQIRQIYQNKHENYKTTKVTGIMIDATPFYRQALQEFVPNVVAMCIIRYLFQPVHYPRDWEPKKEHDSFRQKLCGRDSMKSKN